MRRYLAFNAVGLSGVGVQLAMLALLTRGAGLWVLPATALAVESAILHNFIWHERWTWRDRRAAGKGRLVRLGQFHLANGLVSLAGNLTLTTLLHDAAGVPVLTANLLAIAACSAVNYVASDRLVFRIAAAGLVAMSVAQTARAQPPRETIAAWNAYVGATDARIGRELQASGSFLVSDFQAGAGATAARARLAAGETIIARMTNAGAGGHLEVPGGRVHHWRGALLVPGIALRDLVARLQHPPADGPFPSDVLAMRVMERRGNALTVFMKLSRSWIVTAMYNTEHEASYASHGPTRASSRSVATRIVELERAPDGREREKSPAEDRGFLWRLNSYWRYEQVPQGVIVECESLSLSRNVPRALRPMLGPLVDRIARESMERTLLSLRALYGRGRPGEPATPFLSAVPGDVRVR